MILALYNNTFSYELIKAYLNNKKKCILVNIGLQKGKTSDFCLHSDNFFHLICQTKKLKAFLQNNKIDLIIIPNSNHLMSGMLHSIAIKNSIDIALCVEGTKNFHVRKITIYDVFTRLVKYFYAKVSGFNYFLHFKDDFFITKKAFLITDKKRNIFSNIKNIKEIKLPKIDYVPSKRNILIIGTNNLYDSNFSTDEKKIIKNYSNKNYIIHYLTHPRSTNNNEYYFYEVLFKQNIKLVENISIEDYVPLFKPSTIITVGISSFFYRELSSKINKISLFKYELIKQKSYYIDIYNSFENFSDS